MPKVTCYFNEIRYYKNGKYHREDGPAFEYSDGNKYWYLNGKLHREDGPAVIWANGSQFWYINGKLRRKILIEEDLNQKTENA